MKYRWTYLDDRGKWYMRAKSYYSFGTTLHRVLQRFHDAGDAGVQTTVQALAALDESWIDAGFSNAEEMAEAYGDGKIIIERHVEEAIQRKVTAQTLFVEKTLKTEYDLFRLVGRVDRVDEHTDGTLEIIDYKSGRQSVTQDDIASDIAMSCYQLLLSKEYPGRPVKGTILALRSGESASYGMSAGELRQFEVDICKLGAEIITSDDLLERLPTVKALCHYCDFLPLCRKNLEFAEAFASESVLP